MTLLGIAGLGACAEYRKKLDNACVCVCVWFGPCVLFMPAFIVLAAATVKYCDYCRLLDPPLGLRLCAQVQNRLFRRGPVSCIMYHVSCIMHSVNPHSSNIYACTVDTLISSPDEEGSSNDSQVPTRQTLNELSNCMNLPTHRKMQMQMQMQIFKAVNRPDRISCLSFPSLDP